jgi:hypothetical protein
LMFVVSLLSPRTHSFWRTRRKGRIRRKAWEETGPLFKTKRPKNSFIVLPPSLPSSSCPWPLQSSESGIHDKLVKSLGSGHPLSRNAFQERGVESLSSIDSLMSSIGRSSCSLGASIHDSTITVISRSARDTSFQSRPKNPIILVKTDLSQQNKRIKKRGEEVCHSLLYFFHWKRRSEEFKIRIDDSKIIRARNWEESFSFFSLRLIIRIKMLKAWQEALNDSLRHKRTHHVLLSSLLLGCRFVLSLVWYLSDFLPPLVSRNNILSIIPSFAVFHDWKVTVNERLNAIVSVVAVILQTGRSASLLWLYLSWFSFASEWEWVHDWGTDSGTFSILDVYSCDAFCTRVDSPADFSDSFLRDPLSRWSNQNDMECRNILTSRERLRVKVRKWGKKQDNKIESAEYSKLNNKDDKEEGWRNKESRLRKEKEKSINATQLTFLMGTPSVGLSLSLSLSWFCYSFR